MVLFDLCPIKPSRTHQRTHSHTHTGAFAFANMAMPKMRKEIWPQNKPELFAALGAGESARGRARGRRGSARECAKG